MKPIDEEIIRQTKAQKQVDAVLDFVDKELCPNLSVRVRNIFEGEREVNFNKRKWFRQVVCVRREEIWAVVKRWACVSDPEIERFKQEGRCLEHHYVYDTPCTLADAGICSRCN